MELSGLKLKNFKSHINREIEFGKITVLIGQNNAGKSSILQALILLTQSLQQNFRVIPSRNDVIDLGEYSDIVSNGDEEKNISIKITGFKKILLGDLVNDKILEPENAEFSFNISFQHHNLKEIGIFIESEHNKINYRWKPEGSSGFLRRKYENVQWKLNLTSLNDYLPSLEVRGAGDVIDGAFNKQFSNGDFFRDFFKNFYYIPFHRTIGKSGTDIKDQYELHSIVSRDPEETSSRLLSTLAKDRNLRRKVSELYVSVIKERMEPHNLDPDFVRDTELRKQRITLLFERGKYASSISNEGGGVNQLVLLFTILVGTPKNSIICLEEPEIHLHPALQSTLMKKILKIAEEDDKQIILTTHSEHILYPLLSAVSKGELSKNNLVIHYVQYDNEKNESLVEKLDVNEHGQVKGGLKGFWDATSSAMSDFVREKDEG